MSKDISNCTGIFKLKIFKVEGNKKTLIEDYLDENLVVDVGREAICDLLGGAITGKAIDRIWFGSNGDAATIADTSATMTVLTTDKPFTLVSYPTTTSVQFDWTLATSENNGSSIREFGLIIDDGTLDILYARKVRDVIEKTSSIELQGSWTIIFN